jgi:hypothetical protein
MEAKRREIPKKRDPPEDLPAKAGILFSFFSQRLMQVGVGVRGWPAFTHARWFGWFVMIRTPRRGGDAVSDRDK